MAQLFTQIFDEPGEHRLFTCSDGGLYVADRSGPTPCSTDTGPLRLMTNYRIQSGEGKLRVEWQVLQTDTGRSDLTVSLSRPASCAAARHLDVEIRVRGDLVPLADVLDSMARIYGPSGYC